MKSAVIITHTAIVSVQFFYNRNLKSTRSLNKFQGKNDQNDETKLSSPMTEFSLLFYDRLVH